MKSREAVRVYVSDKGMRECGGNYDQDSFCMSW